jgi:hypothetical protein
MEISYCVPGRDLAFKFSVPCQIVPHGWDSD